MGTVVVGTGRNNMSLRDKYANLPVRTAQSQSGDNTVIHRAHCSLPDIIMPIPPCDFGLPSQFDSWRRGQYAAVSAVLDSPERFVTVCAPTGWGKSLFYMAMAKMSGMRTVVLTSTKGLQDQLEEDFDEISVDIRGMSNYVCPVAADFDLPPFTVVNDAPCQCGHGCPLRTGGCHYFDRFRDACASDIVVTNYQCWMHDERRGKQGFSERRAVDVLVLDEAHDAPEALAGFMSTELDRRECLSLGMTWPLSGYDNDQWRQWGEYWARKFEARIDQLQDVIKSGDYKGSGDRARLFHEVRECRRMYRKLERVESVGTDWIVQEGEGMRTVRFDPLWPKRYAESALFRGVPKVVLVSATVRPKTADLLGISPSQNLFQEYPSSFPVSSRPVIHVPTVRVNWRNEQDDDQMSWWLRKLDLLLKARADRNGIIHTVSYKRARFIMDNSSQRHRMLIHGSDTRRRTIDQFKSAPTGTILLSPSVDTGYDFKGVMAEYQIIAKLPFPDTKDAVVRQRGKEDREYQPYVVAQTLQQMTGRIVRAEWDRGETLVLDDNISWFVKKHRQHFNGWWLDAYRRWDHTVPPPPLEKLESQAQSQGDRTI